jgi:hypothetical protein
MIDTQQQYINLNISGDISLIVVQAHSGQEKRYMHHCRVPDKEWSFQDGGL